MVIFGKVPIREQVERLANAFGLNPKPAWGYAETLKSPGANKDWFAILDPAMIGKKYFLGMSSFPDEMYCRSVGLLHERIRKARRFFSAREGQIRDVSLKRSACEASSLALLSQKQKGGILIVPAQYYSGDFRSLQEEEFVLGVMGVGSIILTHPGWEPPRVNCGDIFNTGTEDDFVPFYSSDWSDGGIVFFDVDSGLDGDPTDFLRIVATI